MGSFVKDDGLSGFAGHGGEFFEAGAAGAGFFRQESEEVKLFSG